MRSTTTDEGRITFERNTEFSGPGLQVFVALDDEPQHIGQHNRRRNRLTAVATPIPGHEGRNCTFLKEVEEGTSIAHAAASRDGDNPADHLMAG